MTPKEKARELINRYRPYAYGNDNQEDYEQTFYYKQCAIITVDEMIEYLTTSSDVQVSIYAVDYWKEVKQEIEKL